jgi:hypothetical protein
LVSESRVAKILSFAKCQAAVLHLGCVICKTLLQK